MRASLGVADKKGACVGVSGYIFRIIGDIIEAIGLTLNNRIKT